MQVRMTKTASILLGALFGFLLVYVGATTFDVQAAMFLFKDFQLPIVLAVAMATGIVGVWFVRRIAAISLITQSDIKFSYVAFRPRLLIGCAIFGIGWALTASCPGTAVAMLGEGKLVGVPVVLGILGGTWIFGAMDRRLSNNTSDTIMRLPPHSQ